MHSRNSLSILTVAAMWAAISTASAESTNLANGAHVMLMGEFWSGGWPGGDIPDVAETRAATLVDGMLFRRGSRWDQGTVWWDARMPGAADNYVVIRWEGRVEIDSFRIQGDDNDAYLVEFLTNNRWKLAWRIPNHDRHGWGLQTFPDPNDQNRRFYLADPIVTSRIRISGDRTNGDDWFAMSEVQAYGRVLE
jgi:hypothetical protein